MTSYYNDYELEQFKSVTNKELNKLLQEVRKQMTDIIYKKIYT